MAIREGLAGSSTEEQRSGREAFDAELDGYDGEMQRRSRNGTAAYAAIGLVLLIIVVIGPVPRWLASYDRGSRATPEQVNAVRQQLLQLTAGIAAATALWFTARNHRIAQETHALAIEQHRLSERGQNTERFGRAIEHLGSANVDVRIGAIHTLERLARDSPQDHPAIMEILSAYVCRKTADEAAPSTKDGDEDSDPQVPRDVQAALTVIGRRDTGHDRSQIDLHGAKLAGADLVDAKLASADLRFTDLRMARLHGADLQGASFAEADLRSAYVHGANLAEADLRWAKLEHLWANRTDFRRARFWGADLRLADLYEANLQHADLGTGRVSLVTPPNSDVSMSHYEGPYPADWTVSEMDFPAIKATGAIFLRADLQNADLRGIEDLQVEQLAAAADTDGVKLPPRFKTDQE